MIRIILVVLLYTTMVFGKTIERIVAIVNDQTITQMDIDDYKQKLRNNQFLDDTLVTDIPELLANSQKLVTHLINEKLVDIEVKRQSLTVSEERIEQEINNIAQMNRVNRRQLIEALQKQNISLPEYRRFIRTKLERQALIERIITPYISISDDDIANYYYVREQSGQARVPKFEYTVAHILFRWPSSRLQDVQATQKQAQDAYALLESGTNFEELITRYNDQKSSSVVAGALGKFKSNEMQKDFDTAIQKLQPRQFSKVIRGARGFHILQLVDKKLIEDPDLTRRKAHIRRALYQEAFQNRLRVWLDQRRHEAFVKVDL